MIRSANDAINAPVPKPTKGQRHQSAGQSGPIDERRGDEVCAAFAIADNHQSDLALLNMPQ
jgi:hypothetical protein